MSDRRHCDRMLFPHERNIGTGSGIASSLNPLGRYRPPPSHAPKFDNTTVTSFERAVPVTPFSLSLTESDIRNKTEWLGGERHFRALVKGPYMMNETRVRPVTRGSVIGVQRPAPCYAAPHGSVQSLLAAETRRGGFFEPHQSQRCIFPKVELRPSVSRGHW